MIDSDISDQLQKLKRLISTQKSYTRIHINMYLKPKLQLLICLQERKFIKSCHNYSLMHMDNHKRACDHQQSQQSKSC